jgi:hypothetical protein
MAYDNTNKGFIAKNDKKEKDTHPDIKGSINVDGTDYWVSGWLKEKDGRKFYSLSVSPKDSTPTSFKQVAKAQPKGSGFDDIDNDLDSVPF